MEELNGAFSGLSFTKFVEDTRITVVGCGATGNRLVGLLTSIGFTVTVYDNDVVEMRNILPQDFRTNDIGKKKVEAARLNWISKGMPGDLIVHPVHWEGQKLDNQIIIAAADSMAVRKALWERFLDSSNAELFIDSRLSAQYFQLLFMRKTDDYMSTWFSDEEADSNECSTRMTPHFPSQSTGKIVEYITNFIEGLPLNKIVTYDRYQLL